MQYAVLGTGIVGRTLATALVDLGHQVVIGTRDPQGTLARTEPSAMGTPPYADWQAANPQVQLATFSDAVRGADAVVNATSGTGSLAALTAAGADNLADKVIIDIANPLDFSRGFPPSLDPVNTDSLGEQIQRAFPQARVVKTLNTMNSAVMVDPSRVAGDHHVFVCGDDDAAKISVVELLVALGWKRSLVLDLGDITAARGTEMLLPVWLRLMGTLGHADFNFHVQGV